VSFILPMIGSMNGSGSLPSVGHLPQIGSSPFGHENTWDVVDSVRILF